MKNTRAHDEGRVRGGATPPEYRQIRKTVSVIEFAATLETQHIQRHINCVLFLLLQLFSS